ncbi:MAG TPA: hypothetical protein VIJ66_08625 [Solirubrobacteraceae bacterium]
MFLARLTRRVASGCQHGTQPDAVQGVLGPRRVLDHVEQILNQGDANTTGILPVEQDGVGVVA